jgi:hypothetical protein
MTDPTPYDAPPAPQPTSAYAAWGDRAVAALWDVLYSLPPLLLLFLAGPAVLMAMASPDSGGAWAISWFTVAGVIYVVAILWSLWRQVNNYVIRQGRTGQTWGKAKVGIWVLDERTGAAPGWGSCLGRWFLHGLINQAVYLDYLWPLWDKPKVQTLTDKILSTVVVKRA